MENAVNIFAFSNFSEYLRSNYSAKHEEDRNFSHRFIAEKLGDKSPSFFQKVLEDKRKLNPHQIEALIRLFSLSNIEAKYFRVLYLYSTAPGRLERDVYLEQLINLNHTPRKELPASSIEYYKNWYNVAIRTALSILDINETNTKELINHLLPKLTTKQIADSIKLLAKLGLIQKNTQGFYKPVDSAIFLSDPFHEVALQSYRHQCLDLAHDAIDSTRINKQSHFFTSCMSVSNEAYDRIIEKLRKFRSEVRAIVHKDSNKPEQVIQIQTQVIPLLEKVL